MSERDLFRLFQKPEKPPLGLETIRAWIRKPRPLLRSAWDWVPLILSRLPKARDFVKKQRAPAAKLLRLIAAKGEPLAKGAAWFGGMLVELGASGRAAAAAFRKPRNEQGETAAKIEEGADAVRQLGRLIAAIASVAEKVFAIVEGVGKLLQPKAPASILLKKPPKPAETPAAIPPPRPSPPAESEPPRRRLPSPEPQPVPQPEPPPEPQPVPQPEPQPEPPTEPAPPEPSPEPLPPQPAPPEPPTEPEPEPAPPEPPADPLPPEPAPDPDPTASRPVESRKAAPPSPAPSTPEPATPTPEPPTPTPEPAAPSEADREARVEGLPGVLHRPVLALGKRTRRDVLHPLILQICQLREWSTPADLARWLDMHKPSLVERHLGPLVDAGLLELQFPDRPQSPRQAYRTNPEKWPPSN